MRALALQLAAHLHPGREFALGNRAHQRIIALAKRIGRGQIHLDLGAHALALQRRFHLGKQVAMAVQIGGGAAVQHLAGLGVGDLVGDGDGGVLGDCHM